MRIRTTVAALVAALGLLAAAAPARAGDDEARTKKRVEIAHRLVDALAAQEYEKATADFDATMKGALPGAMLRVHWERLVVGNGAFRKRGRTRTEATGNFEFVFVTCVFEDGKLDAKVVFALADEVAGLFFQAVTDPEPATGSPPYARPESFEEVDVTVGSGQWALPGTLALPEGEGRHPAVVLVHGSGPNDRDETVGPNKPFRDLAHGLASKGVAVLRYDKRTKVHGLALVASQAPLTVKEETVDDALLAVRLLRERPEIDGERVFVLGHSLGGMLVPRIAASDGDGAIAGFIVLAGATRPLEELMLEQVRYIAGLDGRVGGAEQKQIAEIEAAIEAIRALDPEKEAPPAPILGVGAEYWLDLKGYDPPGEAKELGRRMLVLQGERDYQVTMVDFGNWRKALAGSDGVVLKSYPSLNHLFMAGEGPGRPGEYEKAGHVAEEVVSDVAEWLLGKPAAGERP